MPPRWLCAPPRPAQSWCCRPAGCRCCRARRPPTPQHRTLHRLGGKEVCKDKLVSNRRKAAPAQASKQDTMWTCTSAVLHALPALPWCTVPAVPWCHVGSCAHVDWSNSWLSSRLNIPPRWCCSSSASAAAAASGESGISCSDASGCTPGQREGEAATNQRRPSGHSVRAAWATQAERGQPQGCGQARDAAAGAAATTARPLLVCVGGGDPGKQGSKVWGWGVPGQLCADWLC